MTERFADKVKVPDVVGLPFHLGGDVGVTLANPDSNGPPISALAWPGLYHITSQSPAAGTTVYRWDSVEVEIVPDGEADSNAAAHPHEIPPADDARAHLQRDAIIDLTDSDDQGH